MVVGWEIDSSKRWTVLYVLLMEMIRSLREMTNLTSRCSKGHFGYLLRILTLVDEKMSVEKTQIYFCRNWCAS